MKLLHVKANHFKNCSDEFEIDFVARSRKTSEDKEYELQEIADELYTYNTMAFVGKNASGKTTAVELLDACFSILGDFRLEAKPYSFNNVELLDIFTVMRQYSGIAILLGTRLFLQIKEPAERNITKVT